MGMGQCGRWLGWMGLVLLVTACSSPRSPGRLESTEVGKAVPAPERQEAASHTGEEAGTPPLTIHLPESGAVVGPKLALVFETPAEIGQHATGRHLHIQAGDRTRMVTRQQLTQLGKNRYLFQFDESASPGETILRLYWSDAKHRTLASSVAEVSVIVTPAPS